METRHPVEEPLGREFQAICNHCGGMTARSRRTLKLCEQFLHFLWKNDPSQTVATAQIAPKICHIWLTLSQTCRTREDRFTP